MVLQRSEQPRRDYFFKRMYAEVHRSVDFSPREKRLAKRPDDKFRLEITCPECQFMWTKVHTPDASTQFSTSDARKMASLSNAFSYFY